MKSCGKWEIYKSQTPVFECKWTQHEKTLVQCGDRRNGKTQLFVLFCCQNHREEKWENQINETAQFSFFSNSFFFHPFWIERMKKARQVTQKET